MKYYYHIEFSDDNKLLASFYEELKARENRPSHSNLLNFANQIHKLTKISPPTHPNGVNNTITRLRNTLKTRFRYYCNKIINTDFSEKCKVGKNKLRTFKTFKPHFGKEKYLDIIKNATPRCTLSRFRLSSHKLKIETGRYNSRNGYVRPEDRVCQLCDLNVCEDERHFLIVCPAYSILRQDLLTLGSATNRWFDTYDTFNKFNWLMSNEDAEIIRCLASFIQKAFEKREVLLKNTH